MGTPVMTDPAGVLKAGMLFSSASGRGLSRAELLAGAGAGALLGSRVLLACTIAVRPG